MSQENVERTYRAMDAVNRRDLDTLLALADDDVEAFPVAVAVDGGYHGHEGMRRWWKNWLDVFPDWSIDVVDVHDVGDLTVATLCFRAHGAGSDIPLDQTMWQVVRWQRGKYVWWRSFDTRAEALEVVALPE